MSNARCAALAAAFAMGGLPPIPASAQDFTPTQYTKALWMTTRFYGAMRAGEGPNWMHQGTSHPTSFMRDSRDGEDISGSWFDCGDHVMFGQTQFFATYVLATSYDHFPLARLDLYHGNYSDYLQSGDYSIAGGRPNRLHDLLEEIRYNADFIVKITPDSSRFVLQIGDGRQDHRFWVTAGAKSTFLRADGGESDGPRDIVRDPEDAYAPGMAAAALAVMARRDPDPVRRATYLRHARHAYGYSRSKSGVQSALGGFYQSTWWDGRWREARFLAALELWRTTGEQIFRTQAEQEWSHFGNAEGAVGGNYGRFEFANAVPLARILARRYLPDLPNTRIEDYLRNYRNTINAQNNNVSTWSTWTFPHRVPTGGAFLHALHMQINGASGFNNFIYDQIDYLMGSNSGNQSYIVGWDESGKQNVPVVHHRGFWGNTDRNIADSDFGPGGRSAPARNKYLGGVIPGTGTPGAISTDITSWAQNEVCLEQNAPLVGALSWIVSQLAPVDSLASVSPASRPTGAELALHLIPIPGKIRVESMDGSALESVRLLSTDGRVLASVRPGTSVAELEAPTGVTLVHAVSQGRSMVQRIVSTH